MRLVRVDTKLLKRSHRYVLGNDTSVLQEFIDKYPEHVYEVVEHFIIGSSPCYLLKSLYDGVLYIVGYFACTEITRTEVSG